ncbi:MAG: cobalamin-binding protein [Chloroflexi bacterium]|nr:cobalamin-binding protein [Chloroflexota bacterium]
MNSRKSAIRFLFLLPVLLTSLLACAAPETTPAPAGGVTDQLGRTIRLDRVPERIVSLAPTSTEILFALGLGDKVAGVTDYCDYPPEAKTKPSVGGYSNPSLEKLVAFAPDLVLVDDIHIKTVLPQLESRGITALGIDAESLEQMLEAISLVGSMTGKSKEAASLVQGLQSRIKSVTGKTAGLPVEQRPTVFYPVWPDPLMAGGAGTLHDELVTQAGGRNVAGSLSGYASISLESVLQANPQVMVASVGHGTGEDAPFQFINNEARLSGTEARKNNRVYQIDGNLTSRGGPRLVDGLEAMARLLHPELFD